MLLVNKTSKKFKQKLRTNKKPKFIANLSAELHRELDITVDYVIKNSGLKFDCKAGCVHCCVYSRTIEILPSEAFYMANMLKLRMDKAEIEQLVGTLKVRSQTPEGGDFSCVFLKKHKCSIYDIRPFTCRRHHSLNAKECIPTDKFPPEVDKSKDLEELATAQITGFMDAITSINYSSTPIDLTQGLLTVLTDKEAEKRCKKGQPL